MFLFQQVVSFVTSVPLTGVNVTKNAAKWSWSFTQGILQSLPVKTKVSIGESFVCTFCLFNICLPLSDGANKIKTLNIES